jgi:hypothetical protein
MRRLFLLPNISQARTGQMIPPENICPVLGLFFPSSKLSCCRHEEHICHYHFYGQKNSIPGYTYGTPTQKI